MAANKKLTLELNTVVNDKIGEALKELAAKSSQVESKFQKTYEQASKTLEAIQKLGKNSTLGDLVAGISALNSALEATAEKSKRAQKIIGEQLLGSKSAENSRELTRSLSNVTKELEHLKVVSESIKPVAAVLKAQESATLLANNLKAANLGLNFENRPSSAQFQRPASGNVPPGFFTQGASAQSVVVPEIDTKALSKLQAVHAQEQELAKAHSSTLIGIQLRRDIAIKSIAEAHNAKMAALQAEVDSAAARRLSQVKQDEIAARIAAEVKAADKEMQVIRETAERKIQANLQTTEKFNTYYRNLEARTKAHIEETLAIYRSGDASLEAEHVRWANKEKQIAQKLQEDLKRIREERDSGAVTTFNARNKIAQLQKNYRDEVEAGRKGLVDKERVFQQENAAYAAHLSQLEARTKYHLARTEAIIKNGQDSIQAKQVAYQEAQRNLTVAYQRQLEAIEVKRTRGLPVAEAKQETAAITAEYNAQTQALLRRFMQVQELNSRAEEEHRRHLNNLQQSTQASLAEQHAIHVHGDNSIEVERIRSAERQRQIQETLQRTLTDIERRRQTGGLSNTAAVNESTQAYNAYSAAISATTRQLHSLEQASARAAENHRNLFLRVGEIISAYTIWNAVRTNLWAGLQAIPNIGMALETTKSVLQTTMGGFGEAQTALKLLSAEAERTGINLQALRETWRNFSASTTIAGETVQTSWNIFKNFNTVITSLHLNADKATGIFNALAQIFNKSKVQSEELVKQLGNLLPGAFAAFAKANNFATSELIKKMKAGEVFAHDTIEKFAKFYASTFTESFDLASNSLQANVGRMQNAWTELAETLYSQTSGTMVAVVKGLAELGNWLNEDAKGANVFGESVKAGVALGIGALGSLILSTKTVKDAWLATTATVGLMRTAIHAMAASSNIAMATMTVTANTLGMALKAAFMSNWVTLLIGGLAYAGMKLYELNQEAKAFQEQVEASTKAAEKRRQIAAGTYSPKQEQEDTFKTRLQDDAELKGYIETLEGLKKKKKELEENIPRAIGGLNAEEVTKSKRELADLAKKIIDTEYNIAEKKKEIRKEVDQVYIDQTKDTYTITQRLAIERLQNEGKVLEAAQLQYKLSKEQEVSTLNDTLNKLEDQEEDHLIRLQKLRAIYKADPTKANADEILREEQALADNEKQQRELNKALQDYVVNLDKAGKKQLLNEEKKFGNDRLSLLKAQYKNAEKLQKQHYETTKANLEAQQDELRFIQGIRGEALPELESLRKQELVIQEKINAAYKDQEERLKGIIGGQRTLNEVMEGNVITFSLPEKDIGKEIAYQKEFETLQAKYTTSISDETEALSKAASEFRKLHPDVKVSIESGLPKADIQESTFLTDEAIIKEQTEQRITELKREQLEIDRQRKVAIINLLSRTKDLEIQEAEQRGELIKAGKLRTEQQYGEEERLLNLISTSSEYTDAQKQQAKIQLEIINSLKTREAIQNKLTELQIKQNNSNELLSLKEQAIARNEARGNSTSIDSMFARARAAKDALTNNNYQEQIATSQKRYNLAGPNEKGNIEVELERTKAAYDELKLKGEEVGNFFQYELTNMLVSPLTEFINGQKSAIESMKAFGFAFAEMIQKMIVQELALLAVKQLFQAVGLSSGGELFGSSVTKSQPTPSGLSGQFSSAIPSRASGGPLTSKVINLQEYKRINSGRITGNGTETSDSIKALAPDGSFIIKASSARRVGYAKLQELIKDKLTSASNLLPVNVSKNEVLIPPNVVQKYGVEFFDRLNRTGEMRAEGGPIGTLPSLNRQTASSQSTGSNVTLIVHVNHTGNEKPEDLGERIGVAAVKKIASQEASRQIYLYDKNKAMTRSRSS